jgi:hypothetical protein
MVNHLREFCHSNGFFRENYLLLMSTKNFVEGIHFVLAILHTTAILIYSTIIRILGQIFQKLINYQMKICIKFEHF